MSDWLSLALHDDEANIRTASTNRALIAIKHRTEKRFARYMQAAQSPLEARARLAAIEDDIRAMANEIAIEYSSPEPEMLYQAATQILQPKTPDQHAGASVPSNGYDRKVVDPDEAIGNTPAGWGGESLKGTNKSLDEIRGDSKNHPAETQSVEQRVEDRKDWLNKGDDEISRKVKHIDVEEPIGSEQKGDSTKTFPKGDQKAPVTEGNPIVSRWHVA